MSESRTRLAVRWQCRSSSTPITQVGPTMSRTRSMTSLDVVVPVGDHRPVEAEQHAVQGHRAPHLFEDLVAHVLVVLAHRGAGGAGGEAAALDEGEALRGGAAARDPERGRAHTRCVVRMLAGAQKHAFL